MIACLRVSLRSRRSCATRNGPSTRWILVEGSRLSFSLRWKKINFVSIDKSSICYMCQCIPQNPEIFYFSLSRRIVVFPPDFFRETRTSFDENYIHKDRGELFYQLDSSVFPSNRTYRNLWRSPKHLPTPYLQQPHFHHREPPRNCLKLLVAI